MERNCRVLATPSSPTTPGLRQLQGDCGPISLPPSCLLDHQSAEGDARRHVLPHSPTHAVPLPWSGECLSTAQRGAAVKLLHQCGLPREGLSPKQGACPPVPGSTKPPQGHSQPGPVTCLDRSRPLRGLWGRSATRNLAFALVQPAIVVHGSAQPT